MKLVACSAAAAACVIVGSSSASAAKLPPLGSPEAAKLRPIDLHLSVGAGPNPKTLRFDKWQRYEPPHNARNDAARRAALVPGAGKLPSWKAQVTVGSKTYKFTMLGRTVLGSGAGTTTIKLVVVPLVFKFKNGTFDPAHPFTNCSPAKIPTMIAQSPLFQNINYKAGGIDVGTSQFIDLFRRANFWNPYIQTNNPNYHLLFKTTQAPGYTINVNGNADAFTCNTGANGGLGTVDINSFDTNIIQGQLIPDLQNKGLVNATQIPLFLSYNVIFGGALGYHFIYQPSSTSPIQVYGVSAYLDVGGPPVGGTVPPDIEVLSHEIAEFTDDPYVNNKTPAWGHTGQVDGCQANLEVGDPLTGQSQALVGPMPNGYTYTVTDLAYFSWFYRQVPSSGAAGFYTLLNFFSGPQGKCT